MIRCNNLDVTGRCSQYTSRVIVNRIIKIPDVLRSYFPCAGVLLLYGYGIALYQVDINSITEGRTGYDGVDIRRRIIGLPSMYNCSLNHVRLAG